MCLILKLSDQNLIIIKMVAIVSRNNLNILTIFSTDKRYNQTEATQRLSNRISKERFRQDVLFAAISTFQQLLQLL